MQVKINVDKRSKKNVLVDVESAVGIVLPPMLLRQRLNVDKDLCDFLAFKDSIYYTYDKNHCLVRKF